MSCDVGEVKEKLENELCRKLEWCKRAKAGLIPMFSTHRDCESTAKRAALVHERFLRKPQKNTRKW